MVFSLHNFPFLSLYVNSFPYKTVYPLPADYEKGKTYRFCYFYCSGSILPYPHAKRTAALDLPIYPLYNRKNKGGTL